MTKYKTSGAAQGYVEAQLYIRELEMAYRIEILIELHSHHRHGRYSYWEIIFLREGEGAARDELCRARQPLPTALSANPWNPLMFGLSSLMAELESNPWQWPSDRRKEARGE